MKKICNKDKIFVEGDACPICGGKDFVNSWKGRIVILNLDKSEIAKRIGIKREGEYAIKIK